MTLLGDLVGRDIALRVAVPRTLAEVPKVKVFIDHLESMRALVFGTVSASPQRPR